MIKVLKILTIVLIFFVFGAFIYGALGYRDAVRQSGDYATRADALITDGRGPDDLGADRLKQLILVQDPGYFEHRGIDLSTDGAGLTTLSQSLSKRLGFDEFRPGIGKIRQTGFALGLESQLSKDQILALWLDTVEMGRGPDGWMTGFYLASVSIYGQSPIAVTDAQFYRLLAVVIAPAQLRLLEEDQALEDRSARISRLISGACRPNSQRDVWLDGCA